jgi:hypothetical protein
MILFQFVANILQATTPWANENNFAKYSCILPDLRALKETNLPARNNSSKSVSLKHERRGHIYAIPFCLISI